MYNDWFKIGSVTVHGYGVMIAVGILAAFWMAERLAKRFHLETNKIDNLIFLCVIVGFVGAKGLFILTDLKGFMQIQLRLWVHKDLWCMEEFFPVRWRVIYIVVIII